MANNNNQIFNAALAAFISGAQQSAIQDSVQADYAAIVNAGAAFATQVDSKIPADATIVTPTTSEASAKVDLLSGIAEGAMSGRYFIGTLANTPATYDTVAIAIAACYRQGVLSLALP